MSPSGIRSPEDRQPDLLGGSRWTRNYELPAWGFRPPRGEEVMREPGS